MKIIFNYVYYRIAKFYYKKDGSDAITALLTLTVITFLYLLCLFFICIELLKIDIGGKSSIFEKLFIILFLFFIYKYIKNKYNGKYLVFREKWINERKKRKQINGFFVILFILAPLILLVAIASIIERTIF